MNFSQCISWKQCFASWNWASFDANAIIQIWLHFLSLLAERPECTAQTGSCASNTQARARTFRRTPRVVRQSVPLSQYQPFLSWTVLLKHFSYPVNLSSRGRRGVWGGVIRGEESTVGAEVEEEDKKEKDMEPTSWCHYPHGHGKPPTVLESWEVIWFYGYAGINEHYRVLSWHRTSHAAFACAPPSAGITSTQLNYNN